MKKHYQFRAPIWRYSSDAASWYFVHVANDISDAIKQLVKEKKIRTKGFSFVPIEARIGKTTWQTTLFPSKKDPYLLSIHKKVRNQEELDEGEIVAISFKLL